MVLAEGSRELGSCSQDTVTVPHTVPAQGRAGSGRLREQEFLWGPRATLCPPSSCGSVAGSTWLSLWPGLCPPLQRDLDGDSHLATGP